MPRRVIAGSLLIAALALASRAPGPPRPDGRVRRRLPHAGARRSAGLGQHPVTCTAPSPDAAPTGGTSGRGATASKGQTQAGRTTSCIENVNTKEGTAWINGKKLEGEKAAEMLEERVRRLGERHLLADHALQAPRPRA